MTATQARVVADLRAANLFHAYMRGWSNGVRAMTSYTDFADSEIRAAYTAGFLEGSRVRDAAVKGAGKRYGYRAGP